MALLVSRLTTGNGEIGSRAAALAHAIFPRQRGHSTPRLRIRIFQWRSSSVKTVERPKRWVLRPRPSRCRRACPSSFSSNAHLSLSLSFYFFRQAMRVAAPVASTDRTDIRALESSIWSRQDQSMSPRRPTRENTAIEGDRSIRRHRSKAMHKK